MTQPTTIAGAAVLAGLIVGGGAYTARHGVDGPALAASAEARSGLTRQAPSVPRTHLKRWKPAHVPKRPPRAAAPPAAPAPTVPQTASAAAPVVVATAAQPTTRTSPVASDDSGEGGGND